MIKSVFIASLLLGTISCKKEGISNKIVQASCGQCQFKMKGKGCDLAIKINDKVYYVEGADIDDYGDAHAVDGFCEAIKKASVSGGITKGKFIASSFKILEE